MDVKPEAAAAEEPADDVGRSAAPASRRTHTLPRTLSLTPRTPPSQGTPGKWMYLDDDGNEALFRPCVSGSEVC